MWRCCTFIPAATFAVLQLIDGSVGAKAQPVQASCDRDGSDIVCDVRPGNTKQISTVSASVPGKLLEPSSFEYFDQSGRAADYYFIVQHTVPVARDAIQLIERLTKDGAAKRAFGIATFTDRLNEQKPLGTPPGEISKLKELAHFRDISEKNIERVDIYRPALEAIEKLKASGPAGARKALVIMADGRVKGGYDRDRFLKAANDNNVLVYSIFMARKDAEGASERELKKLESDTNGVFLAASCDRKKCDLDDAAARDFFDYLDRGGRVRYSGYAVSGSSELILNVKFPDNTSAQSRPVAIKGDPLAWWEEAMIWIAGNSLVTAGAAVIGLALLFLVAVLARGRKSPKGQQSSKGQQTAYSGSEPVTIQTLIDGPDIDPSQVYAWLQFLDADFKVCSGWIS